MRIGINIDGGDHFDELLAKVRRTHDEGFHTAWLPQRPGGGTQYRTQAPDEHVLFGYDSLTALAIAGRHVDGIELGTNIVPIFARHPMVLAQQALTLRAAYSGPVTLGLGVAHRHAVEGQWGYRYDRTALRMREYLYVLHEVLRTRRVDFEGQTVTARGSLTIPPPHTVPVLVAALGPLMLDVAGELSDGAITWLAGPEVIAEHVRPRLAAAAERAGRPAPRIVAMVPTCVTDDRDAAAARARAAYTRYPEMPNYRRMLDRQGAVDAADVALIGDEKAVAAELEKFADAGVTDFDAMLFGSTDDQNRTRALLAEWNRSEREAL